MQNSATGTRTRVARVRAEYPNQLDYSGSAPQRFGRDSLVAKCPSFSLGLPAPVCSCAAVPRFELICFMNAGGSLLFFSGSINSPRMADFRSVTQTHPHDPHTPTSANHSHPAFFCSSAETRHRAVALIAIVFTFAPNARSLRGLMDTAPPSGLS